MGGGPGLCVCWNVTGGLECSTGFDAMAYTHERYPHSLHLFSVCVVVVQLDVCCCTSDGNGV